MKTIYWLLFSHLKVYFEISKIKISDLAYECMLGDLSAPEGLKGLWPVFEKLLD